MEFVSPVELFYLEKEMHYNKYTTSIFNFVYPE